MMEHVSEQFTAGESSSKPSSPRASVRMRQWFVYFVVANIMVFLVAQLVTTARAELDYSSPMGGGKRQSRDVSVDNVPSAIRKLASGNAWLMAGVIFLMSGVWPHLKLAATQHTVHEARLGKVPMQDAHHLLCMLEAFGKYTFTDIYLIAVYVACFTVVTPTYPVRGMSPLQLTVRVHLELGAALLVLAAMFSTGITSWAASMFAPRSAEHPGQHDATTEEQHPLLGAVRNRHSASRNSNSAGSEDSGVLAELLDAVEKAPDSSSASRKDEGDGHRWRATAAAVAASCAIGILLVGGWLPLLTFRKEGFLGKLLGDDLQGVDLSLFNLAGVVWGAGVDSGVDDFHLRFFVAALALVTVLAPLLELLSLAGCAASKLVAWPASAVRWHGAACLFNSFNAVDVLLLVCLVCRFEMALLLGAHMGDQCADFKGMINNKLLLKTVGLEFAADPECFTMQCSMGAGLCVAALLILFRSAAWHCLR